MKNLAIQFLKFLSRVRAIPLSVKLWISERSWKFRHIIPNDAVFRFNRYYGNLIVDIDTRSRIQRYMATGYYEIATMNLISKIIEKQFVAMDIGANVGPISLPIASRLTDGKIYAIEPGPPFFAKLQSNLALNPRLKDRLVPLHTGLSNESGELFWREDINNTGNACLRGSESDGVSVPVTTLDKLASELQLTRLDFIKMDVEGMEWNVIRGGFNTIEKMRPIMLLETLIFEDLPGTNDNLDSIYAYFTSIDYTAFSINDRSGDLEKINGTFVSTNSLLVPNEKVDVTLDKAKATAPGV